MCYDSIDVYQQVIVHTLVVVRVKLCADKRARRVLFKCCLNLKEPSEILLQIGLQCKELTAVATINSAGNGIVLQKLLG